MFNKSLINKSYPPVEFDVEKQRVKFFSKVTGQTDPVYFDEKTAQEKGYPSLLTPITFLTTVGHEQENPYQYLDDLSISMQHILHAGQKFKYHKLVFAGEKIKMKSKIKDMYEKKNGNLKFVEIESLFFNQDKELMVESLSILVTK